MKELNDETVNRDKLREKFRLLEFYWPFRNQWVRCNVEGNPPLLFLFICFSLYIFITKIIWVFADNWWGKSQWLQHLCHLLKSMCFSDPSLALLRFFIYFLTYEELMNKLNHLWVYLNEFILSFTIHLFNYSHLFYWE